MIFCRHWHLVRSSQNDGASANCLLCSHFVCSSQNDGASATCLLCSESHVRFTVSYSFVHDMTNSINQIPEFGVQLPGWWITPHSYHDSMYKHGETVAHASFSTITGRSWECSLKNTNRQTNKLRMNSQAEQHDCQTRLSSKKVTQLSLILLIDPWSGSGS